MSKEVMLMYHLPADNQMHVITELPRTKQDFVASVSELIELASVKYGMAEEDLVRVLAQMIPIKRQIYGGMKS